MSKLAKKESYSISKYRLILLAGLLELVYVTGYGVIWFILPIIAENITKDIMLVGLLVAFPTFISMLFAIPVGGFSDKVGRRKPILLGACMVVLIGLSLPFVKSLTGFILFGFFFGLAHQLFNTPIKAYIMDISPKGKTAEYFGVHSTSFSIGLTVGSLAGGFLLANNLITGIPNIAYVYAITGVIAFLIAIILKETVVSTKDSVKIKTLIKRDSLFIRELLEYKKLGSIGLLILYITFIIYFGAGMTWTLEPLYYKLDIDSRVVGLILAMFMLPLILFALPAGYLADKYGKIRMIIPGLLIIGVFFITFGMSGSSTLLLASAFLSTTGLALAWVSTNGLLTDISSKYRRGGDSRGVEYFRGFRLRYWPGIRWSYSKIL